MVTWVKYQREIKQDKADMNSLYLSIKNIGDLTTCWEKQS